MRNKGLSLIILGLSLGLSLTLTAQNSDISQDALKKSVYYLADDALAGRQTGSKGEIEAAEFIREAFREAGLQLSAEDGYQFFDVVTGAEASPATRLQFGDKSLDYGEDFVALSFSPSQAVEGNLVFAGYGFAIENDSISWNDYAGKEVDGRWVLLLRGDPDPDNAASPYAEYSGERHKVLMARDHGAAGVIFVNGERFDKEDQLMDMFFDRSAALADIPAFHIRRSVVDPILERYDQSVARLEENLMAKKTPLDVEMELRVFGHPEIEQKKVRARNVIGILKGSDPLLKEEYVVVGAHYDHLGMGGPGSGSREPDTLVIHNGADDNASGVAAVIELARYFGSVKNNARSIIFVAFSAEEMGLLGSKFFVEYPPVPLKAIHTMINFDMIGRMKEEKKLMIGGSGTAEESEALLRRLGKKRKFDLALSPEGYGASDHAAFYTRDIPVFFISTGAHSDYHTSRDDADMLDYASMKQVVDFSADLLAALSGPMPRLSFKEAGPKSRSGHGRGYKITLGIMPDFTSSGSDGLRVDAVRPDGPGGVAGMKKGDVITALNGKSVGNIYDYMARLKGLEKGMSIPVDVIRDGKPMVLLVQL
jgi:hypothetical protein